jgi:transcription elongation factor Elf1
VIIKDKIKAIADIEKDNCPVCKSKGGLNLTEAGRDYETWNCSECGIEVYIQMSRIPESITVYDEETNTEIILLDN